MGHIFLSYSHHDRAAAESLVAGLAAAGFSIWRDANIVPSKRWTIEVQTAIDESVAVVLLMTPASEASEMVENEVHLATDIGKPIVPVLLSGDRSHFRVRGLHYVDGRHLASQDVVEEVARALTRVLSGAASTPQRSFAAAATNSKASSALPPSPPAPASTQPSIVINNTNNTSNAVTGIRIDAWVKVAGLVALSVGITVGVGNRWGTQEKKQEPPLSQPAPIEPGSKTKQPQLREPQQAPSQQAVNPEPVGRQTSTPSAETAKQAPSSEPTTSADPCKSAAAAILAGNPGEGVQSTHLNCLVAAGQWNQALKQADQLLLVSPGSAPYHRLRGRALQQMDNAMAARRSFERAIDLSRDSFEGYLDLGRLLIETGDTQEALRYLTNAGRLAPRNREVNLALANAYDRVGNVGLSAEYQRRADSLR